MTIGLGSCPRSPTLLQNLIWSFLVLALIPPNIRSHSSLSASILSLGSLMSCPGSGTPCKTRLSLLDSLSLSSSSRVLSILSCSLSSLSDICLIISFISSLSFSWSFNLLLWTSTLLSVSTCFSLISPNSNLTRCEKFWQGLHTQ